MCGNPQSLCACPPGGSELLLALVRLADAVGAHPDAMFDGAPLNAAFLEACEVIQRHARKPPKLVNPVEVEVDLG